MSSSRVQILKVFSDNIEDFFSELINIFPNEGDLLVMQIFFKTQIDVESVMNIFNNQLTKNNGELRTMALERNEKFFIEHNLFDIFGKEKVKNFKDLWCSPYMSDQIKESIWLWIEAFIKLNDAYVKVKES